MALTDNLVAYYKMEGNSTDSAGSNSGTDTDITYSTGNGKIEQGAGFNGITSKIIIDNDASLNFTSALTVSTWITRTGTLRDRRIFSNLDGTNGWILMSNDVSPYTQLKGYIKIGTTLYQINGGTAMAENTLYLATLTYDGSNIRLYLNGVSDATAVAATGSITTNTATKKIGVNENGNNQFWSGNIDECGVWSRALTPDEVTELYNSGSGLSYPFSSNSSKFFQLF